MARKNLDYVETLGLTIAVQAAIRAGFGYLKGCNVRSTNKTVRALGHPQEFLEIAGVRVTRVTVFGRGFHGFPLTVRVFVPGEEETVLVPKARRVYIDGRDVQYIWTVTRKGIQVTDEEVAS